MNPIVPNLIQNAVNDEALSQASASLFNGNTGIQEQIEGALGLAAGMFQAAEAVLLTIMPDDSGSIQGNETVMIEGVNTAIDAVGGARVQDNVLVHLKLLNGTVLCPYVPLATAARLTSRNYTADKGTPLYDNTVALLMTVMLKAQEYKDAGIPVQTVTLIATDGEDVHSTRYDAKDVKKLVDDMHRSEEHIVAAMGIGNDPAEFEKIFIAMGILPKWILTPANSHGEIRRAFRLFSQSAARAAGGSAAFAQATMGGGFTN